MSFYPWCIYGKDTAENNGGAFTASLSNLIASCDYILGGACRHVKIPPFSIIMLIICLIFRT